MIPFRFYMQKTFSSWWLLAHGGSPGPADNDYQFQDEQEFNFQSGAQYEFQFDATP
jgi:hypothetical protein